MGNEKLEKVKGAVVIPESIPFLMLLVQLLLLRGFLAAFKDGTTPHKAELPAPIVRAKPNNLSEGYTLR